MQDEMIVDLYWKRDESAISETERKYGRYLSKIAYNKLEIGSLGRRSCLGNVFLIICHLQTSFSWLKTIKSSSHIFILNSP